MKRLVVLAAAAAVLAACQGDSKAKYPSDFPMNELMAHVVDPAAFLIWNNSGTVVDETGEHERYPTTDEGWMVIENGAAMVAEAGNLLKLPNRPREPVDEWNKWADLMTARAMEVMAAAEAKNKQAVFDTGGRLYETCQGCHEKFIIEPMQAAEKGQ